MAKRISTQQQQMLEDLTGLQHTRSGQIRLKQNRSESETHRLGLETPTHRLFRSKGLFQGNKK
jgi:hypothetical protein